MFRKVFKSKSGNGGREVDFTLLKCSIFSFTVFNYSIQVLYEVKYQV